jgi:ferredoxin
MKEIEVFYFSGTGNSLFVAKEFNKLVPEIKLISMVNLLQKNRPIISKSEVTGFIFPNYLASIPKPVNYFINNINLQSAKYIFGIQTRGGTISDTPVLLNKILKNKGKILNSFFHININMNAGVLGNNYRKPSDIEMKEISDKILEKLHSIKKYILDKDTVNIKDNDAFYKSPLWKKLFIIPFRSFMRPLIFKFWESIEYYADEKCTNCGTCEKVCLSNKIALKDNKPVWQKNITCYSCLACINYCPVKSIQVKPSFFLKSLTKNNDRYHYPSISADEISKQKENK